MQGTADLRQTCDPGRGPVKAAIRNRRRGTLFEDEADCARTRMCVNLVYLGFVCSNANTWNTVHILAWLLRKRVAFSLVRLFT
jgi:hypothetical protein